MSQSVLNPGAELRDQPIFFGEVGGIQRYDKVKYPIFKKLTDNAESNFWRPTEIDMSRDPIDFKNNMGDADRHVFTFNLLRQVVMDTIQGRAPSLAYLPVVSDPWVESFINFWTMDEGIHSKSYTHIIDNVYPDPSEIYNKISQVKEIVDCTDNVSKYYDELLECYRKYPYGDYRTKEAFYLSMVATNGLEQVSFHTSFTCTFSFANQNKMLGSSNTMTLIRQDESIHCGFTQHTLKILPKDDPDFAKIAADPKIIAKVEAIYKRILEQELLWIDFLFCKGPIIGLTKEELIQELL